MRAQTRKRFQTCSDHRDLHLVNEHEFNIVSLFSDAEAIIVLPGIELPANLNLAMREVVVTAPAAVSEK